MTTYMATFLTTYLTACVLYLRTWPNFSHRTNRKWDDNSEYIAFDEFRLSTAILPSVLIAIPHAGAKLVSISDFPENLTDGWILGKRLEGFKAKCSDSMCHVSVFDHNAVSFNHHFCHITAGVIAVCQRIGNNFT